MFCFFKQSKCLLICYRDMFWNFFSLFGLEAFKQLKYDEILNFLKIELGFCNINITNVLEPYLCFFLAQSRKTYIVIRVFTTKIVSRFWNILEHDRSVGRRVQPIVCRR
jgi:hypothetical protein